MGRSRRSTVLVAAALVGAGCLVACTGAGGPGDDRRPADLAERRWPAWATSELEAGAPGSSLVAATGRLRRNDWGVPPSFEWELTFRRERSTGPQEVARVLRRACAFAPARDLTDHRVTAFLVTRGAVAAVPTELTTDCEDGFERGVAWLEHLADAVPPEVRGIEVHVQPDALLDDDHGDSTTVLVATSDATPTVAARVRRLYCAYPGHLDLTMSVRSSARPSAVGDPLLSSEPVRSRPCRT